MEIRELFFILDHLQLAVVQTEGGGRLVYLNPAWQQLTGVPVAEARGRSLLDFVVLEDRAALASQFEALASGQRDDACLTCRMPAEDSRHVWVEVKLQAFEPATGVQRAVIGTLQDVTGRMRAEETALRFRLLQESASDIILFLRPDGRIIDANPAAERLYGYSRAELLQLEILDLREPGTLPDVALQMHRAIEGHTRFETVHRRKDGSSFPVEVSAQGAQDGVGTVVISIIRDITERVRSTEARRKAMEQLEIILGGITEGVLALEPDGRIAYANGPAAQLLGHESEDLLDKRLKDVMGDLVVRNDLGEAIPYEVLPGPRALAGARPEVATYHYFSSSTGMTRTVVVRATPSFDAAGHVRLAVVIFRDISERMQLDRLKSDFLNAVTHELRTPLTSIKGFAEFLEDGIGGTLSPEQVSFVQSIQMGTRQLEVLVDDLLDFARIEAGRFSLKLQNTDVGVVLRRLAESFLPQAREQGLSLEVQASDGSLEVDVDPNRLVQILNNLLSNALKFTASGGKVVLEAVREGETLTLKVADSGIGIAPEHLPRLFTKFFQADSSLNRSFKGTGLGLAITKALVEAHHGTITVDSVIGRGTTFTVVLPVRQPAGAPEGPFESPDASQAP